MLDISLDAIPVATGFTRLGLRLRRQRPRSDMASAGVSCPSPTRQFWRFSTTQGQWVYGSDLASTFPP
jgi:hypothetical protein